MNRLIKSSEILACLLHADVFDSILELFNSRNRLCLDWLVGILIGVLKFGFELSSTSALTRSGEPERIFDSDPLVNPCHLVRVQLGCSFS